MPSPRTVSPPVDFASYCAAWQGLHAGYDPATGSAWVRGWLRLQYRLARPLAAAGISPSLVTATTVVLAAGAVVSAATGGRLLMLGGLLVALSGVGDGLDGAVAVLRDRVTAWGYLLDSVVDRINELLFLGALWLAGAAVPLLVGCAALLMMLLEYVRARGGNAGAGEITVITVGERPTRIVCCALGLAGAGLAPAHSRQIATGAVAALTLLTAVGLAQLLVAARRQLMRATQQPR